MKKANEVIKLVEGKQLAEYDIKFANQAEKVIERGFKQINKELDAIYDKSTDQINWFYVGDDVTLTIAQGLKLLIDNFSNEHMLNDIIKFTKEK